MSVCVALHTVAAEPAVGKDQAAPLDDLVDKAVEAVGDASGTRRKRMRPPSPTIPSALD